MRAKSQVDAWLKLFVILAKDGDTFIEKNTFGKNTFRNSKFKNTVLANKILCPIYKESEEGPNQLFVCVMNNMF